VIAAQQMSLELPAHHQASKHRLFSNALVARIGWYSRAVHADYLLIASME